MIQTTLKSLCGELSFKKRVVIIPFPEGWCPVWTFPWGPSSHPSPPPVAQDATHPALQMVWPFGSERLWCVCWFGPLARMVRGIAAKTSDHREDNKGPSWSLALALLISHMVGMGRGCFCSCFWEENVVWKAALGSSKGRWPAENIKLRKAHPRKGLKLTIIDLRMFPSPN